MAKAKNSGPLSTAPVISATKFRNYTGSFGNFTQPAHSARLAMGSATKSLNLITNNNASAKLNATAVADGINGDRGNNVLKSKDRLAGIDQLVFCRSDRRL